MLLVGHVGAIHRIPGMVTTPPGSGQSARDREGVGRSLNI